jgi:hypothetical protein
MLLDASLLVVIVPFLADFPSNTFVSDFGGNVGEDDKVVVVVVVDKGVVLVVDGAVMAGEVVGVVVVVAVVSSAFSFPSFNFCLISASCRLKAFSSVFVLKTGCSVDVCPIMVVFVVTFFATGVAVAVLDGGVAAIGFGVGRAGLSSKRWMSLLKTPWWLGLGRTSTLTFAHHCPTEVLLPPVCPLLPSRAAIARMA